MGSLFAQGTPGATISGGAVPVFVPGLMTVPFVSPSPERLAIDASAFVDFTGTGPFDVLFQVLVTGVVVAGSDFGTRVNVTNPQSSNIGRFSSSTTLLVDVPAGAHVVAVQWSSPAGGVISTDTLIAANLRVLRLSCV